MSLGVFLCIVVLKFINIAFGGIKQVLTIFFLNVAKEILWKWPILMIFARLPESGLFYLQQ